MRRLVLQYITALAHWGRPLPTPRATNSSELPNNACYTSCRSFASKDYDAQRKTVDLISIKFLSQFISLKRRVSQAPRAAIRQELCGIFFEYRCFPFSLVSTTRSFTSIALDYDVSILLGQHSMQEVVDRQLVRNHQEKSK